MVKLNAAQLRKGQPGLGKDTVARNEIYIILDNVLDTYNIGSIFRLADAVAARKVILCGGSATPPNPRIHKASINTTEWVEWEYYASTVEAISKLKAQNSNMQVIAVELTDNAVAYDTFDYQLPLALVVGHETDGVSEEVLKLCDAVVQLPMFGINISLNVMVSLAIVLYQVIEKSELKK
jgi:23S rRNA (guanosine2251-2'-O)-methyltransferase